MKAQFAGWQVVDGHHLWKSLPSRISRPPWTLSTVPGAIAEAEGHHPDLFLSWGKVDVKDLDSQNRRPDRKRFRSGGQDRQVTS